ncbi:MAG: hypothetical protein CL863_01875 [Cyanobium sp. RS427]|nr:hypothetical protein [Cyanobium sp. RS427]
MKRRHFVLPFMAVACLTISSCSSGPSSFGDDPTNQAALEQLELRVNQLERKLSSTTPGAGDLDPNVPAGPLQSLTLRLGTDDDRLRLYWADGQSSDLLCSEEGKGVWACG